MARLSDMAELKLKLGKKKSPKGIDEESMSAFAEVMEAMSFAKEVDPALSDRRLGAVMTAAGLQRKFKDKDLQALEDMGALLILNKLMMINRTPAHFDLVKRAITQCGLPAGHPERRRATF